ncbi:MAG: hypothetical protein QM726_26025 [Chitinophagaceae bacterium]
MRQPSAAAPKRNPAKQEAPAYLRTSIKPAMGDSIEVMEMYYTERIQSFGKMLEELNVLEDAPEIEFLCREIIEGKSILLKLAAKRNYSA